jgi:hypothetical protein
MDKSNDSRRSLSPMVSKFLQLISSLLVQPLAGELWPERLLSGRFYPRHLTIPLHY